MLVIDDGAQDRAGLSAALAVRGYHVLEASSLEEGQAQTAASPPSLAVLGGAFTGPDSYRHCQALRAEPGRERLPILMVTVTEDAEIAERAFRAGATDILAKPINATLFSYRVKRLLEAFGKERELCAAKKQAADAYETVGLLNQALERQAERGTAQIAATRDKLIEKERELRRSQKMEALGQMAGGVAHEFNNQLTVMSGFARAARDYVEDPKRVRECLAEVIAAADRAAVLTSQMLLFSRDQIISARVMHVGEVIENMDAVLRWAVGGGTDLVLDIDDHDAIAKIDPVQLSQAVLNLAVNARDAMPKGGRLTISCGRVALDGGTRLSHYAGRVDPGSYVELTVKDTGVGMDQAIRERIFDPFFTTKDVGKGSGLGLSVVFGIVEQCGGMIDVKSTPGVGTTFSLYFPVSDAPVAQANETKAPEVIDGVGGTVLVVEDEPAVLELVSMSLRCAGYDVLPAQGGLEAAEVIREAGQDIDLFMTDVVMPGLSGTELAAIFERECPGRPVLFMSGYAPAMEEHLARNGDTSHFIGKPFKPWEIVEKVNQLMAGQQRAQADFGPGIEDGG